MSGFYDDSHPDLCTCESAYEGLMARARLRPWSRVMIQMLEGLETNDVNRFVDEIHEGH